MGSGSSKPEEPVKTVDSTPSSLSTESDPPSKKKEGGGCPMKQSDGSYSYDWKALFRKDFPHGPQGSKPLTSEQEAAKSTPAPAVSSSSSSSNARSGCPVKHSEYNVYSQPIRGASDNSTINPENQMPSQANQLPAPTQSQRLSTERVASTIPKGAAASDSTTWTYPSPQMFYNALARKGKLGPTHESEMESVVAIHNNMNEKTWRTVLEWEKTLAPESDPKLLKFMGRPTDLSPKAAIKHYLLGHPLPFDRHDWTVLRSNGETVRYVIDYYHDESAARDDAASAKPSLTSPVKSLLVDVRPAIDTPASAWNRLVTMPLAVQQQKTEFTPLPLRPTPALRTQVGESVNVWQSIQQAAAGKIKQQETSNEPMLELTDEQAREITQQFAKSLRDCNKQQRKVEQCSSDQECARASVDLTMCFARTVCPLQHEAVLQSLTADKDADAEIALERVQECVALKSRQYRVVQEQNAA